MLIINLMAKNDNLVVSNSRDILVMTFACPMISSVGVF